MRRGDDAHVHRDRRRAAQSLDRALLEHPEQLDLHFQRQIADLIEKERGPVRQLEAADLLRQGAGVRALLTAEQLALHQRARDRRAVHPHHVVIPASTGLMDVGGEALLAGSGLPHQEHRRRRRRHLACQVERVTDRGAASDDQGIPGTLCRFLAQVHILALESISQAFHFVERCLQGLERLRPQHRVGHHLAEHAKPRHEFSRPLALLTQHAEHNQIGDGRIRNDRHGEAGFRAHVLPGGAVHGSLGRQICHVRDHHRHVLDTQFVMTPREQPGNVELAGNLRDPWSVGAVDDVRGVRVLGHPHEAAPVGAEEHPHAIESRLNHRVHLARRSGQEHGGRVGDQRLEFKPVRGRGTVPGSRGVHVLQRDCSSWSSAHRLALRGTRLSRQFRVDAGHGVVLGQVHLAGQLLQEVRGLHSDRSPGPLDMATLKFRLKILSV